MPGILCCSWKEVFELVAIGDAQLAKGVKNKVFSLDLIACDDSVIACNMARVSSLSASILLVS